MNRYIKLIRFFLFVSLLTTADFLYSQATNTNCANPTPFCTGQTMNFPAVTGNSQAQPGPNYGCLGGQPRPTWFYMQILTAGPMVITMSAQNDIDFIAWGPFPNLANACGNLTSSTQVPGSSYGNPLTNGCSFSGSPTETCTIQNAVPGQFYLLLITNWSGSTQNITFQQQNANSPGAATTNCGFICAVTASNSGLICPNQTNTLSMTSSSAVTSFTWTGPNNFSSTSGLVVVPNITTTTTYTLLAAVNTTVNNIPTNGSCQAVTTITVVPYPAYNVPTIQPICQGGSTVASVVFTAGNLSPTNYSITWLPSNSTGASLPTGPLSLPTSVSLATLPYTVVVTPLALNCPITKTLGITVNNPLTPTITVPPIQCNTFGSVSFTGSPVNGTFTPFGGPPNAISPTGVLNPSIAANGVNTVQYSVSVGNCIVSSIATYSVSKFNTAALTNSISQACVGQDPAFNLMSIVQNTFTGGWSVTPPPPNVYSGFVSGNQLVIGSFSPTSLPYGMNSVTLQYSTNSTPFPGICDDNRTLTVQVFYPPTPVVPAITPVCNNGVQTTLVATPSGGVWSGNSCISASGVQTPSSTPSIGNQTVLYTAGSGTCVASTVAPFHIAQFNTAALTGSIVNQCVKFSPVNLNAIVQTTQGGSWGGVNVGQGASSYTFSPAGLPTGIYTLTYNTVSTPNIYSNLCDRSSTIAVSVLNPPTPNISAVGPFCNKDGAVQLTVTPANSGYWTAFPYVSPTGVFSPSLGAIGTNSVQYVTGTSTCSAQQTIKISVEAFVPSTISNQISDQCNTNSAVSLLPITISNSGLWVGAGILGSNFNPGIAGAGTHVLIYKTSSQPSGLCPDQSTLAINVFSLATPVVTQEGPFCNNAPPKKLLVTPIGGLFAGNNNGAINTAGVFNPALGIIGNNIISYSISAGPCVAFAQTTILIDKFVSAALTNPQPINFCQGDAPINLDEYAINPGGPWYSSIAGSISGSNLFNPSKVSPGTVLTVTYNTFAASNPLLCPDQSTVKVTVSPTPTVNLTASSYTVCAPAEVLLEVKQAGSKTSSGKATWFIGDGALVKEGLNISHTFTRPGTYTLLTNYFSDMGCLAQGLLEKAITVYQSPSADFNFEPQEITTANSEVRFNNLSSDLGNNSYQWIIQGMTDKNDINPVIDFKTIGTYRVKLIATAYNEVCKSEITKVLEVKNDFNVFIPSSFSPNFDGLNDVFVPVFSPYGLDTKSYELSIYDRWGHVIYTTKDHTKGWDGTLNNKSDIVLKQDTYNFFLKFKDLEGKVYNKSGSFTLMPN